MESIIFNKTQKLIIVVFKDGSSFVFDSSYKYYEKFVVPFLNKENDQILYAGIASNYANVFNLPSDIKNLIQENEVLKSK